METDYLAPSGWLLLWVALYLVLVIGPAIDAGRQGRWGWVAVIVLLSPLFGLLWYGYRWTTRKQQTASSKMTRARHPAG